MGERAQQRVAVVGARGIGRHHAKWWHAEGARVCAILGRSEESNATTVAALKGMFEFTGAAYTDFATLVERERPDIVDVCSPPDCHAAHAAAAIASGCAVLCEKPFVYDAHASDDDILARAHGLVAAAREAGLRLGLCAQYAIAARWCAEIARDGGAKAPASFGMTLKSPTRGRAPDPVATWIDLGPHLVSAVQALYPGGSIALGEVTARKGAHDATVVAAVKLRGSAHRCALVVGRTEGAPANVRRLVLDGTRFDIDGATGPDGQFCANIVSDGKGTLKPDAMRTLIGEFLRGTAVVGGDAAVENLRAVLAGARKIAETVG